MQVGVPKFSATKLRDAIDHRAISQKELADRVGVQPPQISKYLQGQAPSPASFEALSLALQFPHSYFLSDDEPEENSDPELWRSLKSSTNRSRKRGRVILKWQEELYRHFSQFFDFPKFTGIEIDVPNNFEDIDKDFIDQYCLSLRDAWGLGSLPIPNLTRVLECNGICISCVELCSATQDAVSMVRNGLPLILLNTMVTSSARRRFNVAHELGHLLLHRSVTKEDLENSDKFEEIEEQAHYFATSLLLPEKQLVNDFWAPTLKCLEGIKGKWNVSIQAIMRRCLELNLITSSQFSYLNIGISRKGWRKAEPYDESTPVEKPRLFSQSLERLKSDYSLTPSTVKDAMHLPTSDLSELCMVGPEYFGELSGSSNILQFKKKSP